MKRQLLDQLLAAKAAKEVATVVTHLGNGQQCLLLEPRDQPGESHGDLILSEPEAEAVARLRRKEKSGRLEDSDLFVEVFMPPLRLLIIGAVHISQALAPMAVLAGYQVTVIDPRQAWATENRFPEIDLRFDWPDEALEDLKADARTAVVALTHDPKIDDPGLIEALKSDAFYIAALGSTRTHARRLERLSEEGFGPDTLARIHGPAGLAIGALSPAEIALSVMAEMTGSLRGAPRLIKETAALETGA
ncbi:XdhC family protein [Rhodovibrionaceae bacterium A322]